MDRPSPAFCSVILISDLLSCRHTSLVSLRRIVICCVFTVTALLPLLTVLHYPLLPLISHIRFVTINVRYLGMGAGDANNFDTVCLSVLISKCHLSMCQCHC